MAFESDPNTTKTNSSSYQMQLHQDLKPSAAAISIAAAVAALNESFQPSSLQTSVNINLNFAAVAAANALSANATDNRPISSPSTSNQQTTTQVANAFHQASYCHSNSGSNNNNTNTLAHLQHPALHPASMLAKPNGNQNHVHASFTLPQQMNFNSVQSYSYHRPKQKSAPTIFQKVPLRRGKWTAEEETYANAIIEAFEQGTIQGCENGCTLRAYLSRRLHCQPMRISKKYARKSIGKQVFLSRLNVVPGGSVISSNMETLKQLEFQFHMSVIQEGADFAALHHQKNMTVNGNGQEGVINTPMNPYLGAWHQQQQLRTTSDLSPVLPSDIQQPFPMLEPHVSIQNAPATTFVPQSMATRAAANGLTTPATFHTPQSIVSTPKTTRADTTDIHNSNSPLQANFLNSNTNNDKTLEASQNLFDTFQKAQTSYKIHQEPSFTIHENLFNAFQEAQKANDKSIISTSTEDTNHPKYSESCANSNVNEESKSDASNDVMLTDDLSSGQAQQNWINETMAIIPTLDISNYNTGTSTPTYTSRSFDDLHQFIGNDLPLNQSGGSRSREKEPHISISGRATDAADKMTMENTIHSTTVSHHQNIQVGPDVGIHEVFASASDEYAYYAALSIMEASQHSAYRTPYPNSIHSQQKEKKQKGCDTPIVSHPNNMGNTHIVPSRSLTFSKVNVKLHSKSQENKKVDVRMQGNSSLPHKLDPQSSHQTSKFISTPVIHRHTPVVSAGSSSMEGSSFGSSGSDDNSDSAYISLTSDEGRVSSLEQSKKRKGLGVNGTDGGYTKKRSCTLHVATLHKS